MSSIRQSSRHHVRVALLAVLMCSQLFGGEPASAKTTPLRPATSATAYSVGVTRCTFVDRSRSTPNFETSPPSVLSNSRTLVTEIRYPTAFVRSSSRELPAAKPVSQLGGFPMIVFAHGYDVTPDTYARLLDAWVKAGFVVAAPFFPDEDKAGVTAQHEVNTEDDLWNEPADLAFVTHQMLDASATSAPHCSIVQGLVNASELALAGHSDGATVVGMLSFAQGKDPYGRRYQQLRSGLDFRATVVMSGRKDGIDPYLAVAPDTALLVVQSAADQCNLAHYAVSLYQSVHQTNKWFLELRRAHHLPPFDGVDAPAFNIVTSTSIRFLQIALEGATPASNLVAYGNANPPVASMSHAGNGPVLAPPSTLVSCGLN